MTTIKVNGKWIKQIKPSVHTKQQTIKQQKAKPTIPSIKIPSGYKQETKNGQIIIYKEATYRHKKRKGKETQYSTYRPEILTYNTTGQLIKHTKQGILVSNKSKKQTVRRPYITEQITYKAGQPQTKQTYKIKSDSGGSHAVPNITLDYNTKTKLTHKTGRESTDPQPLKSQYSEAFIKKYSTPEVKQLILKEKKEIEKHNKQVEQQKQKIKKEQKKYNFLSTEGVMYNVPEKQTNILGNNITDSKFGRFWLDNRYYNERMSIPDNELPTQKDRNFQKEIAKYYGDLPQHLINTALQDPKNRKGIIQMKHPTDVFMYASNKNIPKDQRKWIFQWGPTPGIVIPKTLYDPELSKQGNLNKIFNAIQKHHKIESGTQNEIQRQLNYETAVIDFLGILATGPYKKTKQVAGTLKNMANLLLKTDITNKIIKDSLSPTSFIKYGKQLQELQQGNRKKLYPLHPIGVAIETGGKGLKAVQDGLNKINKLTDPSTKQNMISQGASWIPHIITGMGSAALERPASFYYGQKAFGEGARGIANIASKYLPKAKISPKWSGRIGRAGADIYDVGADLIEILPQTPKEAWIPTIAGVTTANYAVDVPLGMTANSLIPKGKKDLTDFKVKREYIHEVTTGNQEKVSPEIYQLWKDNIATNFDRNKQAIIIQYNEKYFWTRRPVKNTIVLTEGGKYAHLREFKNLQEIVVANKKGNIEFKQLKKGRILKQQKIDKAQTTQSAIPIQIQRSGEIIPFESARDFPMIRGQLQQRGKTEIGKINIKGMLDENTYFEGKNIPEINTATKTIDVLPLTKTEINNYIKEIETKTGKRFTHTERKIIRIELEEYAINWQNGIDDSVLIPGLKADQKWITHDIHRTIQTKTPRKETTIKQTSKIDAKLRAYDLRKKVKVDIEQYLKVLQKTGNLNALVKLDRKVAEKYNEQKKHVYGYYHPAKDIIAYFDDMSPTQIRKTLQHEYFHKIVSDSIAGKIARRMYHLPIDYKYKPEEIGARWYSKKNRQYKVKAKELFLPVDQETFTKNQKKKRLHGGKRGPIYSLDMGHKTETQPLTIYESLPTIDHISKRNQQWDFISNLNNKIITRANNIVNLKRELNEIQKQRPSTLTGTLYTQTRKNLQQQQYQQLQQQQQLQRLLQQQSLKAASTTATPTPTTTTTITKLPYEPDEKKEKIKKHWKKWKYTTKHKKFQDPFYRITAQKKYSDILNKLLRERYGNIYA